MPAPPPTGPRRISAVTLATADMAVAVAFYLSLGFSLVAGAPDADFSTFDAGAGGFLNLQLDPGHRHGPRVWGRVIFEVEDVDHIWEVARAAGHIPEAPPADAEWGERYFHLRDPDGHELSFARPL